MSMLAQISVYADVTKNITLIVGQSYTFTPVYDLGLTESRPTYSKVTSAAGLTDIKHNAYNGYSISDVSAFTVTYVQHEGYQYGYAYWYDYTITPLKTGKYTFQQKVEYMPAFDRYESIATYIFTVVEITDIILPETVTLSLGESYSYSPVIVPNGATVALSWSSLNESVAIVSNNGKITAKGLGTTVIVCTAPNGITARSTVTVGPVLVSNIRLNKTETELTVGENLQLQATIVPENTTDKSVTWSSTNEAVAVVDENGQVTAVGSGTCQIKATANDGSGKTASCLVTVEKNNKLTVTDMTQCSGGQGVLNVLLSDEETIMGFQFDLELPTGVTVAEKDSKLLAQLTGNAVNTHSIASSKISDGLYRFIVTPQGSRAISNANGDGMTINIDVADDVPTGTYDMTIKDIEMTVKHTGNVFEDIHPKDSKATLTVTEAVMGDVNGDGRVSVTDVISMNSYILEEEPAQFIRKVADMNGDGKVTITDMVQVIDIILGR